MLKKYIYISVEYIAVTMRGIIVTVHCILVLYQTSTFTFSDWLLLVQDISIYQTSEYPFLPALIGYSSSGCPLDIYWFAKHNGVMRVSMQSPSSRVLTRQGSFIVAGYSLIWYNYKNNYSPQCQCQWIVVGIYLDSSKLSKYPLLFTSSLVNNHYYTLG